MEEEALREASAKLANAKQTWSQARNELVQDVIEAVERYQQRCRDLHTQQTEITNSISTDFPQACSALQENARHKIPDPISGIFDKRGILFSFQHIGERKASEEVDILNLSPPPCLLSEQQASKDDSEQPPPAETTAQSSAEDTTRPPKKSSSKPARPPSRRASRSRPSPAETSLPAPARALVTFLKLDPIKMTRVYKGNYWVFDYTIRLRNKAHNALYVMRCPSKSCDKPVFSKHPLRKQRAEKHLKRCGLPFKDTRDMVRRYAQLIITDRQDRAVSWSWAQKHNLRLLAGDEAHFASENLTVPSK
ncbi:hypothetical protein F5B20DRAFT_210765 [Whalleya microplaca]|nr:hypothetical protein F5B20DRAFT_210765 [Whalleya microplaca]